MPEVASLIEQEIAVIGDFLRILKEEQERLVAADSDALPPLAEQKARLADTLQALKDKRTRLTQGNPIPQALMSRWQELRRLAREAGSLNALNGKLLGERISRNQVALQILLESTSQATVYGPDGQTQSAGSGRPLGSA